MRERTHKHTGSCLVWASSDAGLYWVAAGILITIAATVLNAWVLLIEILR